MYFDENPIGWDRHELLWNGMGWVRQICSMYKPTNQPFALTSIILDIEQEFLREVTELTSFLFAPENIVVKKLHGQVVTCSRMVKIITTYWRHLTDEKNKGVESLVDVRDQF